MGRGVAATSGAKAWPKPSSSTTTSAARLGGEDEGAVVGDLGRGVEGDLDLDGSAGGEGEGRGDAERVALGQRDGRDGAGLVEEAEGLRFGKPQQVSSKSTFWKTVPTLSEAL